MTRSVSRRGLLHLLYDYWHEGRCPRRNGLLIATLLLLSGISVRNAANARPDKQSTDERRNTGCTRGQFECACGMPRCIPANHTSDGYGDCEDASDEVVGTGICPDGRPSRSGRFPLGDVRSCGVEAHRQQCQVSRTNGEPLNQVCVEVRGTPRCTCKLGYYRPPHNATTEDCIPIQRRRNDLSMFRLLSMATPLLPSSGSDMNCTQLVGELSQLYPQFFNRDAKTADSTPSASWNVHGRPYQFPIYGGHLQRRRSEPDIRDGVLRAHFIHDEQEGSQTHMKRGESTGEGSPHGEGIPTISPSGDCNPKYRDRGCPGVSEVCIPYPLPGDANSSRVVGKCIAPINECADSKLNDCAPDAKCMDNDLSYECFCPEGFIDISDRPSIRPGRKCRRLVNECRSPLTNDCNANAECIDDPIGFTCRCKAGYKDSFLDHKGRPGRNCTKVAKHDCKSAAVGCDPLAVCSDLGQGAHECHCPEGFLDSSPNLPREPGRICVQRELTTGEEWNLQEGSSVSVDCDSISCNATTADCVLTSPANSQCMCKSGFVDADPNSPGLQCVAVRGRIGSNPCQDYSLHDCDKIAECYSDNPGYFQCRCPKGFADLSPDPKHFPGRKCRKEVNECALGTHQCDSNADCIDTAAGYTCRCRGGWTDVSPSPVNPGRSCKRSDQCKNADCAPEAECREGDNGPICQCTSGFVDISKQHGRPTGRVCRLVVDECAVHKHDCSVNAACIDTADAFTCRCNDGYSDDSPHQQNRPGRVCSKAKGVFDAPECNVNDPMSCDKRKHEVCLFIDGDYKCACGAGYSRLPDGRCLAINECRDHRLHDCSSDAECIDQAAGYTCQCRSGFADVSPNAPSKPGRICRPRVNECANTQKHGVDCDRNAVCVDTDESYSCRCRPGFADISEAFNKLPGRRCIEAVNECLEQKSNDCHENSICEDAKEGYTCTCKHGFVDASPNITNYPGRVCNPPPVELRLDDKGNFVFNLDACQPKGPNKCSNGEVCSDAKHKGQFACECPEGTYRYDKTCQALEPCRSNSECGKNAVCTNVFGSFQCQCRPGYFDASPDAIRKPGRVCKELVNECANGAHDCSPYADCVDGNDGYACICAKGFTDTSSQAGLLPGRRCSNSSNECADKTLNTCDENADCIDAPDSYTCQCFTGYVDVSSSAHLPPGRVCTVQTTCPKQKTDLMFLIDGSGSIGSYVFKHEVLRFVRDFIELFDIGLDNTRVGLIQYSDQIRHEFDLNQYPTKQSLLQAVTATQYLTGLTRTGAAIQHMVLEGFAERRGARPISNDVSRVAIVITDGRSQDNVTEPAKAARDLKVNTFAIGVTDHVLASELESIAGSRQRWFYVDRFKDLDMRLRSMIQKIACPSATPPRQLTGPCNPQTQSGCARALNEVCVDVNGRPQCQCPKAFAKHPLTNICGGEQCNPDVKTSCPNPEICQQTPFGNYRCVCPAHHERNVRNGVCVHLSSTPPSLPTCSAGLELNPNTGKCVIPGSCDPAAPSTCDVRKRERCLPHPSGRHHTCQCEAGEKRHPATDICLINECLDKRLNDCAKEAICTDTDESYICTCPHSYLDQSPDRANKPGRVCVGFVNECENGLHSCSPNAICTDTAEAYVCRCKSGYVDHSPNIHSEPGKVCTREVNECENPNLNTCHPDSLCVDTTESYKCICKPGYIDLDQLRNPGRQCKKELNDEICSTGKHDCDRNARCFPRGEKAFSCSCPPGFRDKSPDPVGKPGRVCIPVIPECDNPSLNDCDTPDRAICTDTDEGYACRCRPGFLDVSPDTARKPGRLCKPLENECASGNNDCAKEGGICEDLPDSYTCRCAINYLDVSPDRKNRPGRNCKKLVDECKTGQNDCSPAAVCTDTEDSYVCACPATHIDKSVDVANKPGRRCLPRVNECKEGKHDCSPNANCKDTPEGYGCSCGEDFVDESPDPVNRPGRVCRPALVDECRIGKHDCHSDADCQDLPQGYTCQCHQGFLDDSPRRITHPGRKCTPKPTPPPDECRLDLSTSCKLELNEVCRMISGQPKCACPMNYNRDSNSQACTMINECLFPQLNDCHPNAECIDTQASYTCKCKKGFRDLSSMLKERPGRNCQPMVNECQFAHLNDCHQSAQCVDLDEGYECKCHQGFKDLSPQRAGRVCRQMVDECAKRELNSCDRNAKCSDLENGYKCECNANFLDVSPSPSMPGRACRPIVNECADRKLNDCDRSAKCVDTLDSFVCECPPNSKDVSPNPAFPGRVCAVFVNECKAGRHDCDPSAVCRDNEQSFTCECSTGFTDRSPSKLHRPGRVCVKLVDECATGRHTCSPQAECRDLEEGYTCECKEGYVDRSPNLLTQPGRVCGAPETCPSNHDCSSAAVCEPTGGNAYTCSCIQGYVDQSPEGRPGRICVRNSACRDPHMNSCSRNAVCYDEPKGYRCECIRGYVDRSPQGGPRGRVCEPPAAPQAQPRHPCQDPNLNDCHSAGSCRATGPNTYSCECRPGYADHSPDKSKPGRVCVPSQPVCIDPTKNDCHPAAICSEMKGGDGYTCRCRDGYSDQSPDKLRKPGRMCIEHVNECLDQSLNDCDRAAVCEDLHEGYTCKCPLNSIDQSPDPKQRPGRKCAVHVNECAHPGLNSCSRFADCIDRPQGYECKCRSGYHDEKPTHPGTQCNFIINECESPAQNSCHKNAECIDLPGGYECRCRPPHRDASPKGAGPGRLCLFNECADPKNNQCDKVNAECTDTDDGYMCQCKPGFYDSSADAKSQGQHCLPAKSAKPSGPPFNIDATPLSVQPTDVDTTLLPCGNMRCKATLDERCYGGTHCACEPNKGRRTPAEKCERIDKIPLPIRIVSRGQKPLHYSSEYGNDQNEAYVALVNEFQRDMGKAIASTVYAPRYVTTDVLYITHPKTVNSSWPDGLLLNYTVGVSPRGPKIDVCDLWDKLMESLQRSNLAVGGGRINAASDVDLLDPCAKQPPAGEVCGVGVCNGDLGEVCVAGAVCGCANGEKRASTKDHCYPVESWTIPLWVIRKNQVNLVYNETFANPQEPTNKEYVRSFERGVGDCYPKTALRNGFITCEVNDIVNPNTINATWDMGILYNATMYFRKGSVQVPSDVYNMLVHYIIERNGYQVGQSGLYLNPYQPDPSRACFKNDCHPKGICVDLGPNAYRCECGPGYRDRNVGLPGRYCLPNRGYNECENKTDNDCSPNSRCVDLDILYKCECLPGHADASPKGAVPGSVCNLDYCSDVNYCSANSTCVNLEEQAKCECKRGFTDITSATKKHIFPALQGVDCLNPKDIDHCALGMTNCSAVADCTSFAGGYNCSCPVGYVDGNKANPGRICAALLCDLCHQHGDCVHDSFNTTICACYQGYSGEFCEVAASHAGLILLILLAALFLLLALCCLLYLCTRCHCFKSARAFPWSTLDQSASSETMSDQYGIGIPRAKLKPESVDSSGHNAAQLARYLDDHLRIPRAHLHETSSMASGSSEYTIREEIERRVTTDVTKTEMREVTTDAEVHNETNASSSAVTRAELYPSSATSAAVSSSLRAAGTHREEQERGESIAEFANSGQWQQRAAANTSAYHHNAAYSGEYQDNRSIGAGTEDEGAVYDKSVVMKRHHALDPHTGAEKFSSHVAKTKSMAETYHK